MKSLLLAVTLTSAFAMAETGTFTVEGMHCSSCKKVITKTVCEDQEVAKFAESCEVKLTDEKKQLGQLTIVTKKDAKINEELVKAGVAKAGEYKVSKVEIKDMMASDTKTADTGKGTVTETTTTTTETVKTDAKGKSVKEVKKTKKVVKKAADTTTKEETK